MNVRRMPTTLCLALLLPIASQANAQVTLTDNGSTVTLDNGTISNDVGGCQETPSPFRPLEPALISL